MKINKILTFGFLIFSLGISGVFLNNINFEHSLAKFFQSGLTRTDEFIITNTSFNRTISGFDLSSDNFSNFYVMLQEKEGTTAYHTGIKFNGLGENVLNAPNFVPDVPNSTKNTVKLLSAKWNAHLATFYSPTTTLLLNLTLNQDLILQNSFPFEPGRDRPRLIDYDVDLQKSINEQNNILKHIEVFSEYSENEDRSVIYASIAENNYSNNSTGTLITPRVQISESIAGRYFSNPKVAINKHKAIITWTESDSSISQIYYRGININNGIADSQISIIPSSESAYTKNPNIASIYREDTQQNDFDTKSHFIITWEQGDSENNTIYARRITCDHDNSCDISNAINSEHNITIRVSNSLNRKKLHPQISTMTNFNDTTKINNNPFSASDYFIIAWIEIDQNNNANLKGQYFSNYNARFGSEFTLVENIQYQTLGNLTIPKISLTNNGDLGVIFVRNYNQLLGKIFDSEFLTKIPQRKTNELESSFSPSSAIGPNGNLIIVEQKQSTFTDSFDIKFNLYDYLGNPIRNNATANNYTTGNQTNPKVAFFNDNSNSPHYGKFIIVWQGEGAEDNAGIYYRIFNADGTPDGPQLIANPPSPGTGFDNEFNPRVSTGLYPQFLIGYRNEYALNNSNTKLSIMANIGSNQYHTEIDNNFSLEPLFDIALNPEANNIQNNSFKFAIVWRKNSSATNLAEYYFNGTNIVPAFSASNICDNPNCFSHPFITPSNYNSDTFYFVAMIENNNSEIYLKTYLMNITASETEINTIPLKDYFEIPNAEWAFFLESLTSNPINSNGQIGIFATWVHSINPWIPTSDEANYLVRGQFITFSPDTDEIKLFGPRFWLNRISKEEGNFSNSNWFQRSTASYFSNPENSNQSGIMISYQNCAGPCDTYFKVLSDPLGIGNTNFPSTETIQTISSGGKFITVPSEIDFGDIQAGGSATHAESIQIIDLDGTIFNLTVSMSELTHTEDENAPTISASQLSIRNNDGENPEISALNPFTDINDFTLNSSTDNFSSLEFDQTLGEKNNTKTGRWEIYPEFQLNIPAEAQSGSYSGTLTFTLA